MRRSRNGIISNQKILERRTHIGILFLVRKVNEGIWKFSKAAKKD